MNLEALPSPSLLSVREFMRAVEVLRSTANPEDWRKELSSSPTIRSWRYFLSNDPYTRWGLLKPRGYPGDATLMDFAYRHDCVAPYLDAAGDVGREIYAHTSSAAQSESARTRIEIIREKIATVAASGGATIVSFASGHARELEGLPRSIVTGIQQFVALDSDRRSLAIASIAAGEINMLPVRSNVLRDALPDIKPGDLVYSLGLFDYLSNDHATQVLEKMWATVRPGGRLLVANLAPEAANLGYCEAIMDWWMITRSECAMHELASKVTCGDLTREVCVTRSGCFNYLEITRSTDSASPFVQP